ncbi:hypothetical protein ENBRE01_0498 [Enteropsectra breve]|nr:hypothetical protein ENBRE01_0498 [Enteropsectra breve]
MDNGEVYTVDIDAERKQVIYGGAGDCTEIYDYSSNAIPCHIEEQSDSIIFVKFLPNERFLSITYDGVIALMEHSQEIKLEEIGEDITCVHYDEYLFVGTETGKIMIYSHDLEHVNTLGGHHSSIISIDFKENKVLSLSSEFLHAQSTNGKCHYTLKAYEATAFKYIKNDVICFAREHKIQIFKENKKLFEHSVGGNITALELVDNNLVAAGEFNYLLLIDVTRHYAIFKLEIDFLITRIELYKAFQIIFSANDGFLGFLDIRDISTLRLLDAEVGPIFAFKCDGKDIAVGGERGINLIDIDGNSLYPKESEVKNDSNEE